MGPAKSTAPMGEVDRGRLDPLLPLEKNLNASNCGNNPMDVLYTNTVDEIHVHVLGRQ